MLYQCDQGDSSLRLPVKILRSTNVLAAGFAQNDSDTINRTRPIPTASAFARVRLHHRLRYHYLRALRLAAVQQPDRAEQQRRAKHPQRAKLLAEQ